MSRLTLAQTVSLAADASHFSSRPLPTAPDGRYDWEVSPDAGMNPEGHSGLTNLLNKVETIKKKGIDVPTPQLVEAFIEQAVKPDSVDDRKGAFAAGLTLLSKLPAGSPESTMMSNKAIGLLYNTLPHPPATFLGEVHSFRQADGGGNNLLNPELGRAGTKYARSVQGKWSLPPSMLPDPGLIFDTLLKRRAPTPHPGGNSSLTFAFASLVTHSLFRTDPIDWNKNNTSSYLDLSPLYGFSQETQDEVRDKEQGRGLLYPDTFSEERLLLLPPAACALLVILSRNHNYIADMILKINEKKRWSDPPPSDPKLRAQQDEEIFQTARLVNGGHFMSLIMGDYVAGFLGLSEGNAWNMDAFNVIKENGIEVQRGEGNHCSVEFNVLYRWHTTTSVPDEKWTADLFTELFEGKPFDQISIKDFGHKVWDIMKDVKPPKERTFGDLVRGPDGSFPDDGIANILHNATEYAANSYGARSTPESLRVIEMLGIMQARRWGVCSMNEFRKFLGLKEFESFEEWNPDPEIAGTARRLYGHINNLELYTGLQCEAIMPLSGGLRFACGYTMTRAVLGDAICLIRGDRFYTTSFTPDNLTVWGFQDTMRDPNNGGFGGNLPKLLMRHLPRHYPYNSVYGCFPFFTPSKMKDSLTRQGLADQYTYTRPVAAPVTKVLNTITSIDYVFKQAQQFPTPYDMSRLGDGYGFMLCFNDPAKHDPDRSLALHAIFPSADSINQYCAWFRDVISQKVQEQSWTYSGVPGRYVDIVNDVINVAFVHWAADKMCGITMKTRHNPRELFTEHEVYDMFNTLFTLSFLSIGDNENGFSLRCSSLQAGGILTALIEKEVLEVAPGSANSVFTKIAASVSNFLWSQKAKECYPFLRTLSETGRPVNELVAMVIGLAVGSSVNFAQATVNVIDFYIDDSHSAERADIIRLVRKGDANSTETLKGYVREAMRLNPQFTGLWRDVKVSASIPQGHGLPSISVSSGDRLFASFKNAHLNPDDFPNPESVNPNRAKSSYRLVGAGFHQCPGLSLAEAVITEVVKIVFSLKNVRRAEGDAGTLKGFKSIVNETETNMYLTPTGKASLWPQSMHLVYDP